MKAGCQLLDTRSRALVSGSQAPPSEHCTKSLCSGRNTFCFVSEFLFFSFCFEALENELLKTHLSTTQFYVNIFNGVYMFSVKITPLRPMDAHIPLLRKNKIRTDTQQRISLEREPISSNNQRQAFFLMHSSSLKFSHLDQSFVVKFQNCFHRRVCRHFSLALIFIVSTTLLSLLYT